MRPNILNMQHYDIAIVGSGFAGSILARVLRRQGQRVVLFERGRHPRFALGESSTPLAGFALERLAARYDLPDLRALSTWGRWGRGLPDLRRGLKRGFTFFGHRPKQPYRNSERNEARLQVAASPEDELADCHWLRADVDHHLARQAAREGVDLRDRVELDGVEISDRGVTLRGQRLGERFACRARRLVDGSGASGFLARQLDIPRRPVEDPRALVYAHFRGLKPFRDAASRAGATLPPGPYADEQAAVHHLLEEGWMYVLPFDHGVASCGLVTQPSDNGSLLAGQRPEALWQKTLARYPTLEAVFEHAEPVRPLAGIDRIQHRLTEASGERWWLLPHTYAFADPLFSTGMAWSLLAVERLAAVLGDGSGVSDYAALLRREANQIEHLVEAAYLALANFERFVPLSFLYFATVSFAEVGQRLLETPPEEAFWQGFLGAGDPFFEELFTQTLERLRCQEPAEAFAAWMESAIAPRNLVGLADPRRRNLYPLDLDSLVERGHLLGLSREQVRAALPRLRGE